MSDPIRAAIEACAAALCAKDARAVVALRTPDYVAYSLAPPLVAENGASDLDAWFATWRGPLRWTLDSLDVAARGDLAVAHGLVHLTGSKVDGEEVDVWFRQTLCLRELDGAWKIAHEHHSVPFYMDGSYRAATDLKP